MSNETPSPAEQIARIQRVTLWGLVSNLVLAAVKFVCGIVGNSQALVADSVHSLSDSATDIAVVYGAPRWNAPADESHPHGHGRIETLITVIIGTALAAVGIGLIWRALATLGADHGPGPGWLAFSVACLSIVVKEGLFRWTAHVAKRIRSSALMANAWHHRSDALSSVPVAIAVLGTRIQPTWTFLDHIGAVVVAVFIMQAAWSIAWPALCQLIDEGASREEREQILKIASNIPDVRDVHALRTRNIGSGLQIDLHVMVDPNLSVLRGHEIAGAVKHTLLRDIPEVIDVLIHLEPHEDREP